MHVYAPHWQVTTTDDPSNEKRTQLVIVVDLYTLASFPPLLSTYKTTIAYYFIATLLQTQEQQTSFN